MVLPAHTHLVAATARVVVETLSRHQPHVGIAIVVVQAQAKEVDQILVKLDQVKEVDQTPVNLGLLQDQIPVKLFKGQGQIWVKQGLYQILLKLDLDQD